VVLAREGASVTIASRTKARGESLAAELARHGIIATISSIDDLLLESFDLVINATPGGMGGGPAEGQTPLTDDQIARLNARTIVFDTVYNPIETLLLTKARTRGLRTLSGASMFVAQAEAQFSLFTGSPPPSGLFDRIVRERLGSQPG
jgi:shikimate 5-dehydrogenase